MATHFRFDCPHCSTRSAGFQVAYQWADPALTGVSYVLALCGVCDRGLVLMSADSRGGRGHLDLVQNNTDYPGERFTVLNSWPEFHGKAPDHVPPNVVNFYEQGLENLAQKCWDAAGAMFRKSLDVATKILAPEHRSASLFSRIEKMVDAGLLTTAMGDWSHEIRLDGNDAVHDEEPESKEDAQAMHKFAEAFLTYAFTLPKFVENNRSKRVPVPSEVTGP